MAKRHYVGSYEGRESAERTQKHDSSMISEDRGAIANLPQSVIMKNWSSSENYMPENLDDTMRGIDAQINLDNSKRSSKMAPKKV